MITLTSLKIKGSATAAPKWFLHRSFRLQPACFNIERTSVHIEHSEICLSGDEDDVAYHKSSFDPSITNPEGEFQALDKECKSEGIIDPLLFSPCNMAISLILNKTAIGEPRVAGITDKKCGSVNGWTRKRKLVHMKNIHGGPFDRYEKLLEVLKKRASDSSTKYFRED